MKSGCSKKYNLEGSLVGNNTNITAKGAQDTTKAPTITAIMVVILRKRSL